MPKDRSRNWGAFLDWWSTTCEPSAWGEHAVTVDALKPLLPSVHWGTAPPSPAAVQTVLAGALCVSRNSSLIAIEASMEGGTDSSATAHAGTVLLGGFQRFLLANAAAAVLRAEPSEAAARYEAALCEYSRRLLHTCCEVAEAATATASFVAGNAPALARVEVALSVSLLGSVLPLFATGLSWFANRLSVAVMLLPDVTRLARALDALAEHFPAVSPPATRRVAVGTPRVRRSHVLVASQTRASEEGIAKRAAVLLDSGDRSTRAELTTSACTAHVPLPRRHPPCRHLTTNAHLRSQSSTCTGFTTW